MRCNGISFNYEWKANMCLCKYALMSSGWWMCMKIEIYPLVILHSDNGGTRNVGEKIIGSMYSREKKYSPNELKGLMKMRLERTDVVIKLIWRPQNGWKLWQMNICLKNYLFWICVLSLNLFTCICDNEINIHLKALFAAHDEKMRKWRIQWGKDTEWERVPRNDLRGKCITEKEISERTEIGSNTVEKENTSVIWKILEYPQ